MDELTRRTEAALAAPMARMLPADMRALILDLARSCDARRAECCDLRARVDLLESEREG